MSSESLLRRSFNSVCVSSDAFPSRTFLRNASFSCLNFVSSAGQSFTTYEYIEEVPLMVIKKDGRREAFDRNKIISGILKACEKRPVSVEKVEMVVEKIEKELQKSFDKEVKVQALGELVMEHLHKIDEVAYVRFASVYRQFKDINHFLKELKGLLSK